jgi:hypothetical protein
MGQGIVAAMAVVMGTAIGVLVVALGLALAGAPWELHFAARHVATVAVVLTGLTTVTIGVVMTLDVIGRPRVRHR